MSSKEGRTGGKTGEKGEGTDKKERGKGGRIDERGRGMMTTGQ